MEVLCARVVVKEWNMGRICCAWSGHLGASDICALATEFRLLFARTWRALGMRMYEGHLGSKERFAIKKYLLII
jgi:hypothetical protein